MNGRIFDEARFGGLGNMMFVSRVTEHGDWWRLGEDERTHWVEE